MNLLVALMMFTIIPSGIVWQEMKDWKPLLLNNAIEETRRTNVAEPQGDAKDKQKRPSDVPPLLNTQPQTTSNTTGRDQSNDATQPQRELDSTQQWLVVIGIIQAGIIFLQVLYGVRAANAAKKSAEVAERTLVLTQRAFVCFREFRTLAVLGTLTKVTRWRIIMEWDNFGQTPAMEASCMVDTIIVEKGESDDFVFPPVSVTDEDRPATIGPRTGGSANAIIVTLDQAECLTRGDYRLFLCGAMQYQDIFDNTPLHHTTVCAEVLVESDLFSTPNPFRYTAHKKHNYAD